MGTHMTNYTTPLTDYCGLQADIVKFFLTGCNLGIDAEYLIFN